METKLIGNKITEARKKVNISQAQLAEKLFISPQAVGKWERGESMPDIITFNRLAEILHVDLNYFSENFQSTINELKTTEINNEPPSGKRIKKQSWDMSSGNWVDADFSGLKNLHEKFSSSNLQRCKFVGSDLSGILLKNNNLENCDFSDSNLNQSNIQNSNLSKNSFKNCSLRETEFTRSYIEGCDFSFADFTETVFKSGGFAKNAVSNAVWNHTSFDNMYIADFTFEGKIIDCFFDNCAFTNVKFENCTLINSFFKNNKRLKKIQFIDCKADNLTFAFLKNGGADLSGISLVENM